MPIRAVFFLPDLDAGGAQRTVANLLAHLPRDRVVSHLVAARADGAGRAWLSDQARFTDLGARRLRAAGGRLRRLLRSERPDILFATMLHANILATVARLGLEPRPALVLRETNSHRYREDLGPLDRWAAGWTYRRADAVIGLSRGVTAELVASYGLAGGRATTLPNPVALDTFRKARGAGPPPWERGGPVIVAAGRLVRQKGFDLLLHAFARLGRADARLVILGEGPERLALAALAAALGIASRLTLGPHMAAPERWFAHADLFVLSSRWEGFGHVLVEAMAAGAPAVAFDCPYGPADILRDGETGILVPAGDVAALGHAMDRVLGDPALAHTLAEAGARAAGRFDATAVAADYAALFTRLVR